MIGQDYLFSIYREKENQKVQFYKIVEKQNWKVLALNSFDSESNKIYPLRLYGKVLNKKTNEIEEKWCGGINFIYSYTTRILRKEIYEHTLNNHYKKNIDVFLILNEI